jgi:hypothetical protein
VAESLNAILAYQVLYNIAFMGRETAIITRETIPMHRIEKLPSGRGMSGNITTHCPATHTPLLAVARNRKWEAFFNTDLIYLSQQMLQNCVLGDDLNCATSPHG